MGFIDDLLQGGFQGFMSGKQMQRQSFIDQLQQQQYKERLDLEKQELNLRTKTFQFQQPETLQEQMPPQQAEGAMSLPSRASIVPIPKKAEAPIPGTEEWFAMKEREAQIGAKYPSQPPKEPKRYDWLSSYDTWVDNQLKYATGGKIP